MHSEQIEQGENRQGMHPASGMAQNSAGAGSGLGRFWHHPAMQRLRTLEGMVAAVALAAFLVFLAQFSTFEFVLLVVLLLGLAAALYHDVSGRRSWEADLTRRMNRLNADYDRLVREIARNRNDIAGLRKSLADAGDRALSLERSLGAGGAARAGGAGGGMDSAEQRMLRAIADQLRAIGAIARDQELTTETPHVPDGFVRREDGSEILLSDLQGDDLVATITDEQVLALVRQAISYDNIDLFVQPVVNLPQRKTRFYESFSGLRAKPGTYVPAERFLALALKEDLAPAIDNLILLRCLQILRQGEDAENPGRAFFCNITPLTLNDGKFMGDLVEFIAQNRTLAARLIFECAMRDLGALSAEVLPVLDGMAKLGCRFSVDRVDSLSFDIRLLEARHVRFVKIDADTLLRALKERGGLRRLKRLKSDLDRAGIDLIVEKVETEKQLRELLDLNIDYGQGYLFGRPEVAREAA